MGCLHRGSNRLEDFGWVRVKKTVDLKQRIVDLEVETLMAQLYGGHKP